MADPLLECKDVRDFKKEVNIIREGIRVSGFASRAFVTISIITFLVSLLMSLAINLPGIGPRTVSTRCGDFSGHPTAVQPVTGFSTPSSL